MIIKKKTSYQFIAFVTLISIIWNWFKKKKAKTKLNMPYLIPCALAASNVTEHVSLNILPLTAAKLGCWSSMQIFWNSFCRINKKKWKQSSLFLSTVSSRCFICFCRKMVSVILSWARISTALSSNKRSAILVGSNSSSNKFL